MLIHFFEDDNRWAYSDDSLSTYGTFEMRLFMLVWKRLFAPIDRQLVRADRERMSWRNEMDEMAHLSCNGAWCIALRYINRIRLHAVRASVRRQVCATDGDAHR